MYVIVNSMKDKGKALRDHILKDILPRGLDVKIEEIQEKYQQSIEEKNATIALLNDDLKNREYENVGLQGEIRGKDQQIAALQRHYVRYLSDKDENNGLSIIAKRLGCCWPVIKVAPYSRMEIYQMLLLCITSGESIG